MAHASVLSLRRPVREDCKELAWTLLTQLPCRRCRRTPTLLDFVRTVRYAKSIIRTHTDISLRISWFRRGHMRSLQTSNEAAYQRLSTRDMLFCLFNLTSHTTPSPPPHHHSFNTTLPLTQDACASLSSHETPTAKARTTNR